jgi:hypothetical protein
MTRRALLRNAVPLPAQAEQPPLLGTEDRLGGGGIDILRIVAPTHSRDRCHGRRRCLRRRLHPCRRRMMCCCCCCRPGGVRIISCFACAVLLFLVAVSLHFSTERAGRALRADGNNCRKYIYILRQFLHTF